MRQGRIDRTPSGAPDDAVLQWARRDDVCIRYAGGATFRIRDGRDIEFDPDDGADGRALRLLLLGPALAVLLHQRGLLVLHASAIALGESAAAFVGQKGEGKSTLAAALHARGHPLVADDLVPIQFDDPRAVRVRAGFPQLKLGPDVVRQLGEDPALLPRLHPDYEKRARRVDGLAPGPALPLAGIYVLESSDEQAIVPLPAQERFVELVRHSYLAELLESTGEAAGHFKQVVSLASRVPVHRLRRPRDLATLPRIAQLVEEHERGRPHKG